MDQAEPTILPADLDLLLGAALAPVLVDLRLADQISAADRLIPDAIRRAPSDVETWWPDLPRARMVVVFDLSGGKKSRLTAETLRRHGLQASRLDDGLPNSTAVSLPSRSACRRTFRTTTKCWSMG
jgi:rhodanese-related sulfurtransferase